MAKVNPIPDGYHSITPYMYINGAAKALDWYKKALGAEEIMRHGGPGGKIMHAEIKFGDSIVMVADEFPEMGVKGPAAYGGSPMSLAMYVSDVDKVFNQAIAAGGKVFRPLKDQFYGDRSGSFTDPFGHTWTIATHKEDVSPEEMERRMAAYKPDHS
jgi:PhnB protein